MDHICPPNAIFKTKGLPIVWYDIEAPRVYLPLMQQFVEINCCLLRIFVGLHCLEVTIKDQCYCCQYDDDDHEYAVCEEQA